MPPFGCSHLPALRVTIGRSDEHFHLSFDSASPPSLLRFPPGQSVVDLSLYASVLRRFRWLVVPGVLLAVTLAFLSVVHVSSGGITYRKAAVWQSQTLLLLTQPGFPWGRTVLPSTEADSTPRYADPNRFSSLTDLYSQFANSDEVRKIMRREGASKEWKIVAGPVTPSVSGATLPVIALSGQADSAKHAVAATAHGRRAFIEYVARQQKAAAIPAGQRIDIEVLKRSTKPVVIKPRSKTLPIIVFLAVLTATVGLAFVLENLRPRVLAVPAKADAEQARPPIADARRTA